MLFRVALRLSPKLELSLWTKVPTAFPRKMNGDQVYGWIAKNRIDKLAQGQLIESKEPYWFLYLGHTMMPAGSLPPKCKRLWPIAPSRSILEELTILGVLYALLVSL